ncbi:MAG: Fe2+-dependent dioxygenase [Geminicoccaceae bacterium]|nr:Fe2+-dependent dioxygenase [Geminicoccaceae bacterium]MCS7267259.1 Fe2+-dependent dioxygenase [Geminicoccaceae bacterium]MDW8123961.1 Fe2+-dependent dioxygenase [Geminicoccaceae bacterium]MDW8340746.1 Fe2+-dependent dioxygenase [Geminicoccaceae bacterium]
MIICIGEVLSTTDLADVYGRLDRVRFVDGKVTAGWAARGVKDNLQAAADDPLAEALLARLRRRLEAHPVLAMAARPRRFGPLLLSRYEAGMGYGRHVDDAIMAGIRSDCSFTLFLSDPAAYDGGELVIESPAGEQGFKLEPGHLVLYPSTTLHRVETVTRGVRLALVGWLESYVRSPDRRELLFELDTARRRLFDEQGKGEVFDLVDKSFRNLLRMWAET